jgi:hypothetical protein
MENQIIKDVGVEWALTVPESVTEEELILLLSTKINDLIQNDFSSLLTLLYRIDVDERKLKAMLQQNPDSDAGLLIAHMVLDRQKQKQATRKQFREDQNKTGDTEEKW